MDYYMNSAGISTACIREYETDCTENLKKGTILTLSEGKAKKAGASDIVLGVLAADYYAEKDELIPASGTKRMRVTVSAAAIYRTEPQTTTIKQVGTETTITPAEVTLPTAANALKGGYVKLISKAPGSENTDHVGCVRKITASTSSLLTIETGGKAGIGDIYAILPPAGFDNLALNGNADGFTISASSGNMAKVAVCLPEKDFVEYIFKNTFFN